MKLFLGTLLAAALTAASCSSSASAAQPDPYALVEALHQRAVAENPSRPSVEHSMEEEVANAALDGGDVALEGSLWDNGSRTRSRNRVTRVSRLAFRIEEDFVDVRVSANAAAFELDCTEGGNQCGWSRRYVVGFDGDVFAKSTVQAAAYLYLGGSVNHPRFRRVSSRVEADLPAETYSHQDLAFDQQGNQATPLDAYMNGAPIYRLSTVVRARGPVERWIRQGRLYVGHVRACQLRDRRWGRSGLGCGQAGGHLRRVLPGRKRVTYAYGRHTKPHFYRNVQMYLPAAG
jgi:hypothetical protein